MTISNKSQLEKALMKAIEAGMSDASNKIHDAAYEELYDFYSSPDPKMYQRTGALLNSPNKTALSRSGDSVSFEVLLDDNYSYSTGTYSAAEVISAAETGYAPARIVGQPHFWERTENRIDGIISECLSKRLK